VPPVAPTPDALDPLLLAAGALSACAALLHVGCIVFGASWYRFFGAGERLARAAERGEAMPALVTSGIVLVLAAWAAFAWSGAGLVPALPLRRATLVAITAVYLVRGLVPVPVIALRAGRVPAFWWWSSAICLGFGLVHLAAVGRAWDRL